MIDSPPNVLPCALNMFRWPSNIFVTVCLDLYFCSLDQQRKTAKLVTAIHVAYKQERFVIETVVNAAVPPTSPDVNATPALRNIGVFVDFQMLAAGRASAILKDHRTQTATL